MSISKLDKAQITKVLKAALYVGVSAALDYLISQTTGSQFGVFTAPINVALVYVKQLFTPVAE